MAGMRSKISTMKNHRVKQVIEGNVSAKVFAIVVVTENGILHFTKIRLW